MAGIDGRTGKIIKTSDDIKQSIGVILITPLGVRVMREHFGFPALAESGVLRPDISQSEAETEARSALSAWEPRISDVRVNALAERGAIIALEVHYKEANGTPGVTTVSYPSAA